MGINDDTAKFEAIAPTLRWMPKVIRENLSAKAFWSIFWVTATATFSAGAWFTREITQREALQSANLDMKLVSREQTDHLAQIDTKLAVLLEKVDDIGHRVDEQQARWDRAEEGAEMRVPKLKSEKSARR